MGFVLAATLFVWPLVVVVHGDTARHGTEAGKVEGIRCVCSIHPGAGALCNNIETVKNPQPVQTLPSPKAIKNGMSLNI